MMSAPFDSLATAPRGPTVPPAPRTNRSTSPPNSECQGRRPAYVGVDTLCLRGAVAYYELDKFTYAHYKQGDQNDRLTSASAKFGPGLTLQLETWRNPPTAKVECSIPKLIRGNNLVVATADETKSLAERLAREACDLVDWAQPVEEFTIMRVDLTRDFLFDCQADLAAFVEGQRLLSPPYRPPVQAWSNESGYTNLRRGTGRRWLSCLYGKEAEVRAQAGRSSLSPEARARLYALSKEAAGVLRNETRLRRDVLRSTDLKTIGDLCDQNIEFLHYHYFKRAGFDCEVGGKAKIRAAIDDARSREPKALPGMLGILVLDSLGVAIPWSANTTSKYRGVARRYGLTPADLTGTPASLRLDYDTATLVRGNR